jgi:hypothetical protein
MVDIAAISVVSSGVVALGTIAANFVGGERQRKHETGLDFEKRVWERKSEALFTVIEECRTLLDVDEPLTDDSRTWWALNLSRRLDALRDARSTVEALASSQCRNELGGLVQALRAQGVKDYVGHRVDRYEREWLEAMAPDSGTFVAGLTTESIQRGSRIRQRMEKAEEQAVADFAPDLPDLRARAERLLEAARESVRRPSD